MNVHQLVAARRVVANRLEDHGFWFKVDDDMHRWNARIIARGAGDPYPPLRWRHHDQTTSKNLTLFDGNDDKMIATMAWRILETEDLIDEMESGHLYYRDPKLLGFKRWETGLSDLNLNGRVGNHGGLVVWRNGLRLSWVMCLLVMIELTLEECDVQVGETLPEVTAGALSQRFYGYHNHRRTKPGNFPRLSGPTEIQLVWSTKEEVIDEIERRIAILHASGADDFRATVDAVNSAKVA
jgi:hypothetical protein